MKLKRKVQKFYEKSRIRQKGLGTVLEELWQGVAEKNEGRKLLSEAGVPGYY